MSTLFDLTGKVAIITGGSYGIGKAAALSMAREGARGVLVARRPEVLDEACQDIKMATEGVAIPIVGDVSDHDAADRVAGPAEDFCLVVTQRRHVDNTGLVVEGDVARDWLLRAQAFAGPATDGPEAGGR